MKENELIIKLFDDLYDGNPWIDVNIAGTLKNVSPELAATKAGERNSIWEIVNHLIDWRLNVLQRVQGEQIITPADNYFEPVNDISQDAWEATLERLDDSQLKWTNFLRECNAADLEKTYMPNKMSYDDHIHGIIQHDAYHLGQITLLAKYP